jgi:predicted transcriptional regulator
MNKPVLPPTLSAQDEAAFRAAVQEGIEAADAGKLSDFEPVGDWLASWGSKDELPPPE